MDRFKLFDLPVDPISMDAALHFVEERVRGTASPTYIVCANPEKVYALRSDPRLRSLFDNAGLVIPDGIGVALAARLLYGRKIDRLPGADLMQAICASAPARGYRIFIFGSSEEVNRRAVQVLEGRHPGILIVGRHHGYVSAAAMPDLLTELNSTRPDILFVALGSPRQEIWVQQNIDKLHVKVVQTVGGTVDTIAGKVKRAPRWMRAAGIEWLYRLLKNPSRAYRQLRLIRFVADILQARLFGQPA